MPAPRELGTSWIRRPRLWLIRLDVALALMLGLPLAAWCSPQLFSAAPWAPLTALRFGIPWLLIAALGCTMWLFMTGRMRASAERRVAMGVAGGPTMTLAICFWILVMPSQLAIRSAEHVNRALMPRSQLEADRIAISPNLEPELQIPANASKQEVAAAWHAYLEDKARRWCAWLDRHGQDVAVAATRYWSPVEAPGVQDALRRGADACQRPDDVMEIFSAEETLGRSEPRWEQLAEAHGIGRRPPARAGFGVVALGLGAAVFLTLVFSAFRVVDSALPWGLFVAGVIAVAGSQPSAMLHDDLGATHTVWGLALTAYTMLVIGCSSRVAQRMGDGALVATALMLAAFSTLALLVAIFYDHASGLSNVWPAPVQVLGLDLPTPGNILERGMATLAAGIAIASPFWGRLLDDHQFAERPR